MITKKRSVVKSLSYRCLCSAETFVATYCLAHFIWEPSKLSGTVTAILFCTKLITYYMHERIWNKVKWGVKHGNMSD